MSISRGLADRFGGAAGHATNRLFYRFDGSYWSICDGYQRPCSRLHNNLEHGSVQFKGSARRASEQLLEAQLASHNANNSPLIEGPVISLVPRHAKVRREGYRR